MIEIQNIRKKYKQVTALDSFSLQFTAASSVALIGPNGSGKSTLMKCILGLVYPDSGRIEVNGMPVHSSGAYRSIIGYMPQNIRFPLNMQVRQLFSMMKDIRNDPATCDMTLYDAYAIEYMASKSLGSLSGGMKQKVNAALAFMFDPQIIILDEPTAGLDPLSSEILKNKILDEKNKGKLILISSHIMADLEEVSTHVLYLIDGKIMFYKDIQTLKAETLSKNLSKAIATIMQQQHEATETH